MRWIGLGLMLIVLNACIFVEGQIIEEPKDIVVSPRVYPFTADYPCQTQDQTQDVTPQLDTVRHCGQ